MPRLHYFNYYLSEASVIIAVISRAKQVWLLAEFYLKQWFKTIIAQTIETSKYKSLNCKEIKPVGKGSNLNVNSHSISYTLCLHNFHCSLTLSITPGFMMPVIVPYLQWSSLQNINSLNIHYK